MPNIGNYAKVVQDWTQLLAATEEHAAKMTDLSAERQELEQTLQKAEEVKARQESHTASRQASTQELGEILAHGRDVAMRLRFAAKVKLGPRSEQLVQFGAAPLRKRKATAATAAKRRAKEKPEPVPEPQSKQPA
jgi:hypothetical protein